MRADTTPATTTASSFDTVRSIRDAASTITPTASVPTTGISIGAMIRLRSSRLAAVSPVARSAQASIVHSTIDSTITARPSTNTIGCSTSPTAAAPTPKEATTGQKLAATG